MRYNDGKRLFSATDLMNYLGCTHSTWLDLHIPPETLNELEEDEESLLLKEKGLAHERAYRDQLVASGLHVAEILPDLRLDERLQQTLVAMKRGEDVVYQAALLRDDWHGFIDFLRRTDEPSVLGSYSYSVEDTKLSHSARPKYLVQLCVYAYLIEAAQGRLPQTLRLVLGNGRIQQFRTSDFIHYVQLARGRFAHYVMDSPPVSRPEPCAHCAQCKWQEHCQAEWEATDHLSLVANIQRSQIGKLNEAGILTLHALAATAETFRVPRIGAEAIVRLRAQAVLQAGKRDTGRDRVEILPVTAARGFCRLPQPDDSDLFFDMEGDPLYPDGLEYLFGFCLFDQGRLVFQPFWGHDREEERRAFEVVMDFVVGRLSESSKAHLYHYSHYEPNALKFLASHHGTREEEVDWLLRNQKFVDLFKVVREGFRTSQPGYSLKDIEQFYRPERSGGVKSAGGSIVMYERWRITRDQKLLDEVGRYNEEDCRSTYELREWLLGLRPTNATWFVADVKQLDTEKQAHLKEFQQTRTTLEQQLLDCDPAFLSIHQLVCDLLDFHRREQKPEYWKMFDRREQTDDELVEDAECIGGLRLSRVVRPYQDKQSIVYTYQFPEQETKFEVGDDCQVASTLVRAGTIVGLDTQRCTVSIKRARRSGPLPEAWSAIPMPPLDARRLRDAIYRFAEAEAKENNPYRAVRSVLLRDFPHVRGISPGAAIVAEGTDLIEGTTRAVLGLADSHLLVQGPPGTGKTYTASHVIVELLRKGRRVGVSSNSHKAIHNLLRAIEKRAQEVGVRFRGVKKASVGNDETFYKGAFFKNVTRNADVTGAFNLVAGTVYLYAELQECLDYLFVDEAGQVSLANLVVMGMAALNLVLVGDQMQLAQPIQGAHPGKSGLSVLEYLLEDEATVPANRGVFLATTYRMQSDICNFISEAVYDRRLGPAEENQRQRLILGETADPALKSTGIQFVEVNHEGCSQRSEAEGEVIRRLYGSLLAQQFVDCKGVQRPVSHENVMVITPYNVQVNHLRSILPSDARVGTVDKLQGQEAEVVLISMATSGGDDLPRNIEFLYSRNRLNVAISRARILACIVASPRLLQVSCSTVEQMKLVNTLCWAQNYAHCTI